VNAYQLGQVFGAIICPLLLIGFAYYLIKGRSVPFRSALFNPWVVGLSFVVAATNLTVRSSPASPTEPELALSKDEMVSFYAGCLDKTKARMDERKAKETCACIISGIQSTLSRETYATLNSTMEKTGVVPPEIGAIAGRCEPTGN
jgi:hypothetical protein